MTSLTCSRSQLFSAAIERLSPSHSMIRVLLPRPRLCLLEDDPKRKKEFSEAAKARGYEVEMIPVGEAFELERMIERIRTKKNSVVIFDYVFQDGRGSHTGVLLRARGLKNPIVVYSRSNPASRQERTYVRPGLIDAWVLVSESEADPHWYEKVFRELAKIETHRAESLNRITNVVLKILVPALIAPFAAHFLIEIAKIVFR